MKSTALFRLSFALISMSLLSCEKATSEQACFLLAQANIHLFAPVMIGEPIELSVDDVPDALYKWTGPGNFQSYNQNNTITSYAELSDRGWYYVHISNGDCPPRNDSIYVDVKFPQGNPSCSLTNNTANFSGSLILGDQSFYYVNFGNVSGGYGVTANSSNGDLNIKMSPYWNTNDLEDGIYYTTSDPLPEYSDLDKIFISDVNNSIYWVAEPNKPVYISHVNGKQRISFCDIEFSGSWGSSVYQTTIIAQVTQP